MPPGGQFLMSGKKTGCDIIKAKVKHWATVSVNNKEVSITSEKIIS